MDILVERWKQVAWVNNHWLVILAIKDIVKWHCSHWSRQVLMEKLILSHNDDIATEKRNDLIDVTKIFLGVSFQGCWW